MLLSYILHKAIVFEEVNISCETIEFAYSFDALRDKFGQCSGKTAMLLRDHDKNAICSIVLDRAP